MHSIFYIPELLMQILLYLELEDFPNCYRVSHHWRTTIKTHLPPSLHPLPDSISGHQKLSREPLPIAIRDLATSIQVQNECCILSAQMLELGDEYLCWQEGTHAQVLKELRPHLHPFLAHTATELISGLDSVVRRYMEICVQTTCSPKDLIGLFDNEAWRAESMAVPYVKSVEVYARRAANWDLSNKSVMVRGRETWARHLVRIEREKGVRMGDVIDELRGVLVLETSDVDDDSIVLEWRFDSA